MIRAKSEAEETAFRKTEDEHLNMCPEHMKLLQQHVQSSEQLLTEAKRQSKALEDMAREAAKSNKVLQQLLKTYKCLFGDLMAMKKAIEDDFSPSSSDTSSSSSGAGSSSTNTNDAEYVHKSFPKFFPSQPYYPSSSLYSDTLQFHRQSRH